MYKLSALFVTILLSTYSLGFESVSPDGSLYDLSVELANCDTGLQASLCGHVSGTLNYTECALYMTDRCPTDKKVILRVLFNEKITLRQLDALLSTLPAKEHVKVFEVNDVDECSFDFHMCSQNAFCRNTEGAYECQCSYGYTESSTSPFTGAACVKKCHARSCRGHAQCQEGTEEDPETQCVCNEGYSGDYCNVKQLLPSWAIIVIGVVAGLAALCGLALCGFSIYKICCKKSGDDASETRSISDYKPKSLPQEYSRFTDLGSVSRGSNVNFGYQATINEEPEELASVKNDAIRYGGKRLEPRLSMPSEHGDPTPALAPFSRTDRHNYTDVESQPDYY